MRVGEEEELQMIKEELSKCKCGRAAEEQKEAGGKKS